MVQRLKLVIGGTIGGGVEEWSTSCHYSYPTGEVDGDALSTWAGEVKTLFGAITAYPELKTVLSSAVTIGNVSAYGYPASGPAEFVGTSGNVAQPGTGSASLPPQIALTATLRTALAGRRNRGRMYWPAMGADFGISAGQSFRYPNGGALADDIASYLTSIGDAWPGPTAIVPVVYSAVADTLTPVSEVSVGDVFDTQRRRRDEMVENYQSAPVPS